MNPEETVKVTNKTRGTILAHKAHIANTPISRLRGLLGRNGLNQGEGLIIKPCSSIHTWFMRFTIDAVFLNKGNRVVSVARSLPPWRLFGTLFKGKMVIELPAGEATKSQTENGDMIEIQ